jgi:EmrB/QacA subfamily drug resistance transporter
MKNTNRVAILSGLTAAMMLAGLDQTVVATALPRIVTELGGLSQLSWVFTAYMMTSTITVPIYGKLSDIFGRRGLFFGGIAVFLLGSVLSGLSQNMIQLIFFRGLQGIGAGSIMVNTLAVIGDTFPRKEQARWQGMIGAVFGVTSVIGPLLGGWITDNFGWRWIFYINLPVGLAAIAVLSRSLPVKVQEIKEHSIDFLGASLITLFLVPLLLAFVWAGSRYAWNSIQIIGLFVLAFLSLSAFIWVERRAKDPIISLQLFKNRVFSVAVVAIFLTTIGMFGIILYLPLFAQGVVGVSATTSGLILVPMMLSMAVTSVLGGQIVARNGNYKIISIFAVAIMAVGMFLFSKININSTSQDLTLRMIIFGVGLGPTMAMFVFAIQNAFDRNRMGVVTASAQLFRGLGATVGSAILGGVMNAQLAQFRTTLQNEPFVALIRQHNPGGIHPIDSNTVQQFLSPQGQARMQAIIARAPASIHDQLLSAFNHFLQTIKFAFSQSIDQTYLVGFAIIIVAFIVVLFLPQVAIREDEHKPIEEAGLKLAEELGQSDKVHQPEYQTPQQGLNHLAEK